MMTKSGATKDKPEGAKKMNDRKSAALGVKPRVYDIIGKRLREYYEEVASQPVPDRFLELLDQLDQQSQAQTAKSGASSPDSEV